MAVLLLTLPDLLTQVLAAGAIVAVLVPVFQTAGADSGESAALFRRFTLWASVLGLALGAMVWLATPAVLTLLAPGFGPWQRTQAAAGLSVVAWTLPIAIASAVSAAWLQAQGRFALVTAGTLLFNLAVIAALLGVPGSFRALGVGLVVAVAIRWGSQVLALGGRAWQSAGGPVVTWPEGLARRYAEAAGAAAVVFAAPLVARALASLSGDGTVAMLNYATRVIEVPMGLAVGVVPVVLFPSLAAAVSTHDEAEFQALLAGGWAGVVALSLPIAGTLLVFGDVAAQVVFALSGLEATAIAAIGRLIGLGALGLPALGAAFLYQSALNARLDTRGPLLASAVYVAALVAVGRPAAKWGGGPALVAAMSLCQWVFAGVLAWRLWRVHRVAPLSRAMLGVAAWALLFTVALAAAAGWGARDADGLVRVVVAAACGGATLAAGLAALWRAGVPLPWKGVKRAV